MKLCRKFVTIMLSAVLILAGIAGNPFSASEKAKAEVVYNWVKVGSTHYLSDPYSKNGISSTISYSADTDADRFTFCGKRKIARDINFKSVIKRVLRGQIWQSVSVSLPITGDGISIRCRKDSGCMCGCVPIIIRMENISTANGVRQNLPKQNRSIM